MHSTKKNVNLVHNAVTKNEMQAWEDFIASLINLNTRGNRNLDFLEFYALLKICDCGLGD